MYYARHLVMQNLQGICICNCTIRRGFLKYFFKFHGHNSFFSGHYRCLSSRESVNPWQQHTTTSPLSFTPLPTHSDQNMDEASDKTCSNCQVNFSYALGCVSQLHSQFCHIISKMIMSLNEIKLLPVSSGISMA